MEWLSNQTDVLSEWACTCINAIRVLLKASTYVYISLSLAVLWHVAPTSHYDNVIQSHWGTY